MGRLTLTILRDGSRVYVANQKDSTVSVVSLTSFQVLATIPVTGHPISIASTFSTPYGQVYVLPSDQAYMSVIRTDTDQVSASIQLDGNGVDVHTTAQIGSRQRRHAGRGYECHQRQSCQWQWSTLWFWGHLLQPSPPRYGKQ